jgi:trehalose-6-phosphate synthase
MGICPWGKELISGLLGSSIVGFQTQQHCNNFIDSVDAFMESRIDREANAIVQGTRRTLVRPYPISIEWPVRWLDEIPSASESRASVLRELGLRDDALLGVGVDRLDYTKGIEERLLAVDALLAQHAGYRGRFVFLSSRHQAAPRSRATESSTSASKHSQARSMPSGLAMIIARWFCCGRTTNRRPCLGTFVRPIFAT